MAYANSDYLTQQTGMLGRSASYRIVAESESLSLEEQEELARRVDAHLVALGYEIKDVNAGLELNETTSEGLNILTTFLLIMSFLLASVGSIGLMGTMSLNVMERTREIGVLRAIGASDGAVISLVLVEGMIIGGISWLLGSLAGLPISRARLRPKSGRQIHGVSVLGPTSNIAGIASTVKGADSARPQPLLAGYNVGRGREVAPREKHSACSGSLSLLQSSHPRRGASEDVPQGRGMPRPLRSDGRHGRIHEPTSLVVHSEASVT